ncbi:MAG: GNAT family N-acetyltransferase [Sciscionella sp.]|nr:GNAT family N-acetyltransferase [Sciscionella sp.]
MGTVFVSLEDMLGDSGVFARLYPDWRAAQRNAVTQACRAADADRWVAELDELVVGFVVLRCDHDDGIGEIEMIAVDPEYQHVGVGSCLTHFAVQRMREQGMAVAMVETGGDPGHASARQTYQRAGFVQLPVARYFKKL